MNNKILLSSLSFTKRGWGTVNLLVRKTGAQGRDPMRSCIRVSIISFVSAGRAVPVFIKAIVEMVPFLSPHS